MSAFMVSKEHVDCIVRVALEGPQDRMRAPQYPGDSAARWALQWREDDESAEWGYVLHHLVRYDGLKSRETDRDPDELGQLLLDENVRSIEARYPDTIDEPGNRPGPNDRTYQHGYIYNPQVPRLTIAQAFTALDCYVYQACETGAAYYASEAHAVVESLRALLMAAVPGGRDGAWDVSESDYTTLIEQGAGGIPARDTATHVIGAGGLKPLRLDI